MDEPLDGAFCLCHLMMHSTSSFSQFGLGLKRIGNKVE